MANSRTQFSDALLKLARDRLNSFFLPGSSREKCVDFVVDGKHIGYIKPDVKEQLLKYPDVFVVNNSLGIDDIQFHPNLKTSDDRSDRLATVLQEWREKSCFSTLKGWRNECYDIWSGNRTLKLFKVERSAVGLFGLVQYGVHINGYLNHSTKGLCMWIGRRSPTKQTYPGLLDNMAAGGITSGDTVMVTARKECREEASVPDEILDRLKPAGVISYFMEEERGLLSEQEFIMDLEVTEDFKPVVSDGEVDKFQLMTIEEVKESVTAGKFKANCGLVIADFMYRHGIITPDNEPHYCEIQQYMHTRLPQS
ncbi:uncharacterized protein LOC135491343 isoform X2 [Lineus longissimus]